MQHKTIITCHANADIDALASMIGAYYLYKDSVILYPGSQEKQIQTFFEDTLIYLYPCITPKELIPSDVTLLVVVDAHTIDRVPHAKQLLQNGNTEIHIWDHHPVASNESGKLLNASFFQIEKVGAASTLLAEEIERRNINMTCEPATILAGGIFGDTGSFLYAGATRRDFLAAAKLIEKGADQSTIQTLIAKSMGKEQLKALSEMLEHTETRDLGSGEHMAISTLPSDVFLDNFATLAPKIMEIEECQVIFALASMDDKIQVVGRSKSDRIDVGKICSMIGGGGHHYAAAASVKNKTLPQLRDFLLFKASLIINPDRNAGKLMSSPAIGINQEEKLSDALTLMNHFGLKAVPVFADEEKHCVGLLSQELATRAVSHNLGQTAVKVYMQRNFKVLSPDAGMQEIVDIMLGEQQRLIPIIDTKDYTIAEEDDESKEISTVPVIGVVTRTDIIRLFLGGSENPLPPISKAAKKERNLANLMKKKLAPACTRLLTLAGSIADDMHANVYVIGGFVRDLVMDNKGLVWPDIDIDLVIEGNSREFAHRLGISLNGYVREHSEFLTAMVLIKADNLEDKKQSPEKLADSKQIKIDIASARMEFYSTPGALPQVERSSIKMDLYRRDFSINAMAIRLNSASYGQLVDFFDGQEDIKNKRIRTLHALSFVEDPTRVFRAVRFEQRYDFVIGAQCERFIHNAVDELDLIHQISGSRISHEMELMVKESTLSNNFVRLNQLGILSKIHPLLSFSEDKYAVLESLHIVIEWYKRLYLSEKPDYLPIIIILLCRKANSQQLSEILHRLQFTEKRTKLTLDVRGEIINLRSVLSKRNNLKQSELHQILRKAHIETLLYLLSMEYNPVKHESLTLYIYHGRNTKSSITGHDLIDLGLKPGPIFTDILDEVLGACIDDPSLNREQQLKLLEKITQRYTSKNKKYELISIKN